MARRFVDDYAFGIRSEAEVADLISAYLGVEIYMTGSTNVLDIRERASGKNRGELKSRTIPYNRFPTVVIGKNKIDSFTDPTVDYYCFFRFTDGLYAIKYNAELFSTFRLDYFQRLDNRRDYNDRPQMCYYIPMDLLHKVEPPRMARIGSAVCEIETVGNPDGVLVLAA